MKPVAIEFLKNVKGPEAGMTTLTKIVGTLVGFGMDTGEHTGSWTTGIIILPDGQFANIPIERLRLVEPFKEEDWPA